jgi:YbbR domain-containing protein
VSARDFVRRRIVHNLGLKLTSLLLASALWLAVSSSPVSEVALRVPIIFRSMPANLEICSQNVPEVQLRVRGPERLVRRLQPQDLRAELDLSGVTPGERTFDLTRAIGVPNGLELSQVSPSEVQLAFDARARRQVTVKPRVIGTFVAIETNPATVEITGPRRQVEAVDGAITDPIDVTGVLDHLTVMRPAYVSDPLIQVVNPRPVQITITIQKGKPIS